MRKSELRRVSKQIKYIADCPGGICKLNIKDIVRVNPTPTKAGYRKCKKHGGLVIKAELVCEMCGESFQVDLQKASTKTCWKCKEKAKEEKSLLKQKKKDKIAAEIAKKKKRKEANARKRLSRKKEKARLLALPKPYVHKPIVPVKGSYHSRGDYCTKILACNQAGPLKCDTCTEFDGVFFGHDPLKMPGFMRIKDLTFG